MFDFLGMMGNYEDRCVARFDDKESGLFISTARVTDGEKPIETAVAHPDYNDGDIVIVAKYDTEEQATEGHANWIAWMTTEPLPEKLVDCGNSGISQLCEMVGLDKEYPRNN